MGYQELSDDANTHDPSPMDSPPGIREPPIARNHDVSGKDPILEVGEEEAIRLCRVYEEEMGLLYPILNIEEIIIHAKNLVRRKEDQMQSLCCKRQAVCIARC